MAVNPTGAALKAFVSEAPDEPVVMLNLLRFLDGGAERYERYLVHLSRYVQKVGGRIVYYGRGGEPIVAEAGQAWDAVLLVAYPWGRPVAGGGNSGGNAHLSYVALITA